MEKPILVGFLPLSDEEVLSMDPPGPGSASRKAPWVLEGFNQAHVGCVHTCKTAWTWTIKH